MSILRLVPTSLNKKVKPFALWQTACFAGVHNSYYLVCCMYQPLFLFSMSLNTDQTDSSKLISKNNNNNVVKHPSNSSLKAQNSQDMRKSPVMMALEQEEQEPGLYKGGKIQSKSFQMLEKELEEGNSRESVFSGQQGSNSEAIYCLLY